MRLFLPRVSPLTRSRFSAAFLKHPPRTQARLYSMGKPNKEDIITAYDPQAFIEAFSQDHPGSDQKMKPLAEHTRIEKWDQDGKPYLEDYVGSGKLKNKVALVTGGDSGIGRSVAVFFAREGADVSITYLPAEEEDAQVAKKLVEKEGRKAVLIPCDLSEAAGCKSIVEKHIQAFGRLDILVNNASTQVICPKVADLDPDTVLNTFKTNIISMILVAKYALPYMKRGSTIINSTSVTAYEGSPGLIDYSSTKGAIVTFTRSLAGQQASNGIRVNAVAPGPVYTPLQPASRPAENMEGWELGKVPLNGRAAQPAELGGAYVFCASYDSAMMTGQVIHVNGGQHIGGS